MITLKDLDRTLVELKGFHKKSPFCPKKNMLSYRLSKMSSQYRGGVIERIIRDYYRKAGKKVAYFSGNCPFDMIVNGYKVEVKSALAKISIVRGQVRYSYNFKHICPKNFHKLVMVFVSPEGVQVRVMNSETVSKYTGSKKTHKNLYISKRILGKVLVA